MNKEIFRLHPVFSLFVAAAITGAALIQIFPVFDVGYTRINLVLVGFVFGIVIGVSFSDLIPALIGTAAVFSIPGNYWLFETVFFAVLIAAIFFLNRFVKGRTVFNLILMTVLATACFDLIFYAGSFSGAFAVFLGETVYNLILGIAVLAVYEFWRREPSFSF